MNEVKQRKEHSLRSLYSRSLHEVHIIHFVFIIVSLRTRAFNERTRALRSFRSLHLPYVLYARVLIL